MSWIVVAVVGALTVAIKGAGTLALGDRELPPRVQGALGLVAPVMLAALVATQAFADDERLEVDARLAGVAAAGLALVVRAPLPVVVALAALVTGILRQL